MNVRTRLAALEERADVAATACPTCGADWVNSVYLAVEPDGTTCAPRCLRCQTERPKPRGYRMECWERELIEAL